MKPKIALIITSDGIDTITVISAGSQARKAGYELCSFLEDEINGFETAIKNKLSTIKENARENIKQ